MISTLDGVIQANGGPSEQDGDYEYAGWERPIGMPSPVDRWLRTSRHPTRCCWVARRTTSGALYWPGQDNEIGRAFNRVPKCVASRGTPELTWDVSIQVTDAGAEVRDPRQRHEQIHTWGSANLLQTLLREALVNQVNMWVCPVVLGKGKKLYPEGTAAARFEQVEPPRSFPGGVVLVRLRCLEGHPGDGERTIQSLNLPTGRLDRTKSEI